MQQDDSLHNFVHGEMMPVATPTQHDNNTYDTMRGMMAATTTPTQHYRLWTC
jgi:hypothetical protein